MPGPLTDDAALDVLRALSAYHGRTGRCPSIQELAADMGIPRTTLHHRLAVMKDRRLLRWEPGQPRTLVMEPGGTILLLGGSTT